MIPLHKLNNDCVMITSSQTFGDIAILKAFAATLDRVLYIAALI